MARVMELLRREMGWEKIKDRYIDVYADTFTEGEMKEICAFYRTPIGQKYIEKTPLLMEKSLAVSREVSQRLFPEILKMAGEAADAEEEKGAKGE